MEPFLREHWNEDAVRADVAALKEQHSRQQASDPALPPWPEDLTGALLYIGWLMDRDIKSTPLKSLQGNIWRQGYCSGELRAEVFPDVPQAFSRWAKQNRTMGIFSSGSVLAQQLLFANTTCGNLSGFLQGYFDTTTGSKVHPESYRKIAASLSLSLSQIIFISDTLAEVDAAAEAGMETALCERNNSSTASGSRHPVISTLDQVFP